MSQLINVTSEALQATIRRLLPSQAGFSEDLQATNLITPIIDLTPTAEGSQLPASLRQALDLTSNFTQVSNTSVTITSTPGFYVIRMNGSHTGAAAATAVTFLDIVDGGVSNTVAQFQVEQGMIISLPDFVVFIDSGQSLSFGTNNATGVSYLTARQVATLNGELINPNGFEPQ